MKILDCSVRPLQYGLMAYLEEVEEAAVYHVHLILGDKNKRADVVNGSYRILEDEETFRDLTIVDVSRETKYHSFVNLAHIHRNKTSFSGTNDHVSGMNYYIKVEAEDRSGKIIARSRRLMGIVE